MADVQDLAKFGYSEYTIATKLGISVDDVRKQLGKVTLAMESSTGHYAGRQGKPMTPEEREKISGLIASGLSYSEVARETGWSESSLRSKFPQSGSNRLTPEETKGMLDMYNRGLSPIDLAREFKVSKSTVNRVIKKSQDQEKLALWHKIRKDMEAGGRSKDEIKFAYNEYIKGVKF